MTRPRFAMAATAALALLLAGCSGGGGAGDQGGADAAPEGPTRVVTDSLGEQVTIPAAARRVVTLHYAATLPMVEIGAVPVGQAEVPNALVPPAYGPVLAPVPVVTVRNEPQLEQVGLLAPDLIIAPDYYKSDVLGQLRKIAPVYTISLRTPRAGDQAGWQRKIAMVADAVGRSADSDRLAAAYDARRAQIARTRAGQIRGTTVAAITPADDTNFYLWGPSNGMAEMLASLGFTYSPQAAAVVAGNPQQFAQLSSERIGTAVGDADLLFLDSDLRGQVSPFMTALQQTPLYRGLPSVRAGHAYPVGKNLVAGYSDANYSLDRLERALQDMPRQ